MRHTVIVADTRLDAVEAAVRLGLPKGSWLYPQRLADVLHIIPARVVYVDGWEQSTQQTAEMGQRLRLAAVLADADEIHTRASFNATDEIDRITYAWAELDRARRARKVGRISIDPDAITTAPTQPRSWLALFTRTNR